jgi:hypothetical protein
MYKVTIDNEPSWEFNTIKECLIFLDKHVYISPEWRTYASHKLKSKKVFRYSYGFKSLEIKEEKNNEQ